MALAVVALVFTPFSSERGLLVGLVWTPAWVCGVSKVLMEVLVWWDTPLDSKGRVCVLAWLFNWRGVW